MLSDDHFWRGLKHLMLQMTVGIDNLERLDNMAEYRDVE